MEIDKQKSNIQSSHRNSSLEDLPEYYLTDELLNELRIFCEEFNPYEELSLKSQLRLNAYGITRIDDPFMITNKLLMLLENNLQYRERIKKENDN